MPVSMVCESTANVNAALRDSLSVNCSTVTDESKTTPHGGNQRPPLSPSSSSTLATAGGGTDENDDIDTIQSKLVASAKRVLMSKIDYEEVSNYGQSVLDTLKTKYILLQPANNNNNNRNGNMENNGRKSPANNLCNGNGNNNNNSPHATNGHCNANSSSSIADNNNTTTNGSKANGSASAGNNTTTNNNAAAGGNNNNSTLAKRPLTTNSSELPQAKRVLFPRELVRIGWKNSNRKWQIGSGFLNMGNTCYLNSTLQALFHVPSMANWLMSDSPHMDRCDGHDTSCIICAMIKTLQSSQNSQSAIRPYFICSKLKLICKTMAIGRQEDAHEFLRHLVDAMERSYLQRFHYYKELDQYSKETTPLNQILGGYLKSSVRCLSCSHVSVTFQHFQDILLDIRKGDSIEEAMEMYFARERLEDMGYKCESCKKKVSATKQFSLERAPIVLCIQLKRFSVMGAKLNKQITMKTRLDLSKFASRKPTEQLTYRLVSMITHLGATQHCGHYTAIGLTESGNYYCYDDSSVRPISVQSVCNTNAYVIFYEMDNTAATRVDMNGGGSSANAKENYQKQNGHVLSNGHNNHTPHQPYMNGNSAKSPQRIIGPQLPPGGLAAYKASPLSTNNNGGYANGPNSGSKLLVNRQNSIPTSNNNNKLMIHFKNTPNSITNKLNSTSSTSSNTNTNATSESSSAVTSSSTTHNGGGKFQSSSALADAASKGQNNAIAQSSSPLTDEDEVSSSTGKHLLPDMPNLLLDNTPPTRPHSATPLTNGGGGAKLSLKSLVPYDSESDADDELADSPVAARRLPMKGANANGSDLSKSSGSGLKRRYSIASYDSVPNLSPKKQTDGSKSKTDAIDEIFNYHKRNTTPANGHQKKQRPASYCSYLSDNDEDSDDDYDKRVPRLGVKLDFTKAPATPPSPPVVETKTGIWQVTQIQSEREKAAAATEHINSNGSNSRLDSSAAATEQSQKSPKNPKNPFASKPIPETAAAKRPKLQNGGTGGERREGNGYQRGDANSDGAVSELLKQSHRGYGAPVLTWNGQQTEVEKELLAEARQQRQREWEEEEELEMDRGRQKKSAKNKLNKEQHGGSSYVEYGDDYNPFQEQDMQQRRWKRAGGGHHRVHYGHVRQQFQRNKFKFHQRNKFNFNKNHNHHQQQQHNRHKNNNHHGGGGGNNNRRGDA